MTNLRQHSGNRISQPKYLIPLMIFAAVLMIGVRLDDMWNTVANGEAFHPVLHTQAAAEDAPQSHETSAQAVKTEQQNPSSPGAVAAVPPVDTGYETDAELLKQIRDRRDQLDQRLRDMDTREALIKVAEQRVDQKIKEMEVLKGQLQAMVGQVNESQQAQLDNLVKIYETMKAKEAAKIFEQLEMPTLLGVLERMKPAKVAVIMAEMAPEKAKEITVALTKKDQLPQIK